MRKTTTSTESGVTLVEVIIVFLIVGIILTFAYPAYYKAQERSKSKHAEFNLQAVYNAQKRHKLAYGTYYACDPCVPQSKDELGVNLNEAYFDYIITNVGGFSATATRKSGPCAGRTMTINQDSSEVQKGCDLW